MGAYCRVPVPRHIAAEGETLKVLWSDYYGAALFGERREIACVPHGGCRLEIVATATTRHREGQQLLPGQGVQYKRTFWFFDQLVLPSGRSASLWHFVGFTFRLAPAMTPTLPIEEHVVRRAEAAQRESVQTPVLR